MEARDLMSSPVITVAADATVGQAARLMLDERVSCLPVVAHDELVGILTHFDFGLHHRYHPLTDNLYTLLGATATPDHIVDLSRRVRSKPVKEVMRPSVVTIDDDAPIADVAEKMVRERVHRLPVMRGSRLVGIITRHDLLKLIAGQPQ
jgi:CBS domain-containing protein